MAYQTDTQDPKIGVETRGDSFYFISEGIFEYGGKGSVEITYEAFARLLVAVAAAPDVKYGMEGRLDAYIRKVLLERYGCTAVMAETAELSKGDNVEIIGPDWLRDHTCIGQRGKVYDLPDRDGDLLVSLEKASIYFPLSSLRKIRTA